MPPIFTGATRTAVYLRPEDTPVHLITKPFCEDTPGTLDTLVSPLSDASDTMFRHIDAGFAAAPRPYENAPLYARLLQH